MKDKIFSLKFTVHVLDWNKLTGPIPELLFQNGSNLEVVDFGAFFVVGCILDFQRDVYLLNILLGNKGWNEISSTIPSSISSLLNTKILNFGK